MNSGTARRTNLSSNPKTMTSTTVPRSSPSMMKYRTEDATMPKAIVVS